MVLAIVLLILGLALVCKGGDLFVDSSVDLAEIFHIPKFVIGATIVSIGTTTPELMVSAFASLRGNAGIAVGNATGSAIANIGLIIGAMAFISREIHVNVKNFRERFLWFFASIVLVIGFSWNLRIHGWMGIVLFLLSATYLLVHLVYAKKTRSLSKDSEAYGDSVKSPVKMIFMFLLGLLMIILGSRFMVNNGIYIAEVLGIPSVIIGLSVIAIGTSLPELVTGIASARKGVPELAFGNIIGANVLNLALIIGVSAMIQPLELTRFTQCYSFSWLIIFAALMFVFVRNDRGITRREGAAFLFFYAVYVAGLVLTAFMS